MGGGNVRSGERVVMRNHERFVIEIRKWSTRSREGVLYERVYCTRGCNVRGGVLHERVCCLR